MNKSDNTLARIFLSHFKSLNINHSQHIDIIDEDKITLKQIKSLDAKPDRPIIQVFFILFF